MIEDLIDICYSAILPVVSKVDKEVGSERYGHENTQCFLRVTVCQGLFSKVMDVDVPRGI